MGSQATNCFLAIATLLGASSSWARSVRVGYIDFHPIVSKSENGPEGHLINYVTRIFEEVGLVPQWRELSLSRAVVQLQQGQIDLFLTLLKTPEREKMINYSQAPLFEARSAVCSKPQTIQYPMKRPLRIVHFLSTVIPEVLQDHTLVPVTPDDVTHRMLVMLDKDRADAVFYIHPEVLGLSLAQQKTPFDVECHVLTDLVMPVYIGYSKKLPADLEEKLNAILMEETSQNNFGKHIETVFKEAQVKNLRIINVTTKFFELPQKARKRP